MGMDTAISIENFYRNLSHHLFEHSWTSPQISSRRDPKMKESSDTNINQIPDPVAKNPQPATATDTKGSTNMKSTRLSNSTILARIASLRTRHRQVDEEVSAEQKQTWRDGSMLRKLKRRRLRLKDEIKRYEGLLATLSRRSLPG
jgi:hypothetical protein